MRSKKIVIELDGQIHDFQKNRDKHREDILKAQNLDIIRIKNKELTDVEKLIRKIENFLKGIP